MTNAARFKLNGKVYDSASLDEVTLKDLLAFEAQTATLGTPVRWTQLEAAASDVDESGDHPLALWVLAATIWLSRRIAGEDVTLEQALDVSIRDIEWVTEPQDHQAPSGPTKARKGTTQRGSGQAAKARREASTSTTSRTSAEPSANA